MDETLKAILAELKDLKAGQQAMQTDIAAIKNDIELIKEDAAEIRTTVNAIGEWTEAAADVLKIKYPL